MAHPLEGRMDLTSIERSRLLGSLATGTLGQLGSASFSTSDPSRSQLTASASDLPRPVSPTALQQYAGRFLPSSVLPPSGSNYAMMASYLASTGHVPDALKHLLPEMQQYWSSAHQDNYARYVLGNMYYPYLPYLPATESLALFAQNSNVAQMEAALQAQAVQHRIYDLQKEALFGSGTYQHGPYPHAHLYSPSGQLEATNLSLPSTSRDRKPERPKETDVIRQEIKIDPDKPCEKNDANDVKDIKYIADVDGKDIDGSERTRGRLTKTDDKDKIKSSMKTVKDQEVKKSSDRFMPENLSKKLKSDKNTIVTSEVIILDSPKASDIQENGCDKDNMKTISHNTRIQESRHSKHSPNGMASHSPKYKQMTSTDNYIKGSFSPDRRKRNISPPGKRKEICADAQDMPENLCIKDRHKQRDEKKSSESDLFKTQSIITTSTVNVNSTLDIITTGQTQRNTVKASSVSPSQTSPSSSRQSTMTTYSLPYYHNLYTRPQSQDGKRVHATTYVPEIKTICSPVVRAPSVINVVDTKSKLRDKIQAEGSHQPMSSLLMVSPNADIGRHNGKSDVSNALFIDTNVDVSRNQTRCDSDNNLDCNNRICVQTDLRREKYVSPSRAKLRCSEFDTSIDLSMKKSPNSNTEHKGDKVSTKSPVTRKRDRLHSPKAKDTEMVIAHDLRKVQDNAKDVNSDAPKRCAEKRKACDMNHNSKDQTEVEVAKKPKKNVPSTCKDDIDEVITVTDSDDSSDKSKGPKRDSGKDTIEYVIENSSKEDKSSNVSSNKSKSTVRPLGKHDSLDKDKEVLKRQPDSLKNKNSPVKQTEGGTQSSGIPIGIAVARQRNIAPKLENDSKKDTTDSKRQQPIADVKPIRPLKVIRPSTKGCGQSVPEKRNELPANLIVTGGTTSPGVFWPDDPTSRQLAAQFIQTGHPLTPTSWYGGGALPYPQNITTTTDSTTQPSQLPITVPAGYKLAQDPVTGQILLLPTGSEVFDSSRIFSGLPLGSQITGGASYGAHALPDQSTPVTLPANPSLFQSQQTDKKAPLDLGLPTYGPTLAGGVLAGQDVSIKEDKLSSSSQSNSTSIITPSIILPAGHGTPVPGNQENSNEKSNLINLSRTTSVSEMTVAQCSFTFSSPTVPIVFNPSLITPQNVNEQCPDVTHLKQDHTSVQSRGTSPMLPASDSCAEDTEENKSDDNTEEIVDVCDIDSENATKAESVTTCNTGTAQAMCKEEHVETRDGQNTESKLTTSNVSNKKESGNIETNVKDIDDKKRVFEISVKCSEADSKDVVSTKSPKSSRNLFTDLSEYNPFMDPQVLQAADGLELLSALAEKSALRLNEQNSESQETKDVDEIKKDVEIEKQVKTEVKVKSEAKVKSETNVKKSDKDVPLIKKSKSDEQTPSSKPRIKCGFAFKPKKEKKRSSSLELGKTTTFCGISIPEDDEVIDSIETEMKMRLAELQKRYKEKQRQLAKLTPKKPKETDNKGKEDGKQKSVVDTQRGPGRPKKKVKDSNGTFDSSSEKSPKSRSGDHSNKTSPTNSAGVGSSGQHGPTKKKKIAEMLVDRVFRKTASSFKIPLSKKINLIAPARIEFPGASPATERSEHARHNKAVDFGKLIKRSRLSQINGKESGFVGGLWHRKYGSDKKHSLHKEIKLKKRKKEHAKDYSASNGLSLLAEYATKSSTDVPKKKRKLDDSRASSSLSPDSPNKKRKPGRPKKCEVVRPGVTETIVAKQSKHMDFFRWQPEENKPERKISLEGKAPLKPLYLDEWNVRRSERIFLSDPSPQTSPNAISPGVKNKQPAMVSPGQKPKQEAVKQTKDKKITQEKQKKSQSFNMSQKVKKKYSTGFNQNKAREKTTELLKATRDRLTQKRQEKKMRMLMESSNGNDDSDSDDVPLSLFKPKPKSHVEVPRCTLTTDELCDGMRILVFMDGLFHEGELKAIRPPDIYGAILDNERKTRPHYYSQEEILKEAIKETKPTSGDHLGEGTRICAYWSQQFSCLYPGTISRGSPNPVDDKSLFNVEFDDGDTGKIPIDHIRIIPQDFPHVEYDPNPLLLLTKRRRTMSTSESTSSEPKKSTSELSKDKWKRGPGRPPKAERLLSNESIGDEDVFLNDTNKIDTDKKSKNAQKNNSNQQVALFRPRELWGWSGSSTKRPGMKGKAKKEYYKTVVRGRESISVGEAAVFLSTGRPNLPYVGRIESFWEGWGGQMVVKVKWFYHPEETKGGKRLHNLKGALFRSDHEDENDVQTISHKCEVIPYGEYKRRVDVISHENTDDVYYLAGSYEPTIGNIKFEPGVL